jgi:hypothetical protein
MTARFPNDDDKSSWEDENSACSLHFDLAPLVMASRQAIFPVGVPPVIAVPPSTPILDTGAISTALNSESSPAAHVLPPMCLSVGPFWSH